MRIAVAGVQAGRPRAGAPVEAERLAAAAAAAGAGLLVLPQRFLAGTCGDPASAGDTAEPSDGPGARAMREVARGAAVALAYGYVERCSGAVYDALMLVDSAGSCVANYRRTHVASTAEDGGIFERGQWLSVAALSGRRVGLLLGYDLAFPEPARALALAGCDLLVVAGGFGIDPAAGPALLAARAVENRRPVAFASAHPAALPPEVRSADGRMLGVPGGGGVGTTLLVAELPEPAAGAGLRDRRPRLYARLTAVAAELPHLPPA